VKGVLRKKYVVNWRATTMGETKGIKGCVSGQEKAGDEKKRDQTIRSPPARNCPRRGVHPLRGDRIHPSPRKRRLEKRSKEAKNLAKRLGTSGAEY